MYATNKNNAHKLLGNHNSVLALNVNNFDKTVPNAEKTDPSFLPTLYVDFAKFFKARRLF